MTAQFRIGGYYRDKSGDIVQLTPDGRARWMDEHGDWDLHGGIFCLTTGECSSARGYRYCSSDLLPGELHNVNGQWVPVAEEASKTECEVEPFSSRACELGTRSCTKTHDTDPVRPPLTWATPKPVDRFPVMASQAPNAYGVMPPSAMDWLTSTEPHGAASREWRDGWDACRNFVSMRVRDAERTNGVTEVQRAEAELEEMRQHGDVDDATEAAAHLERVRHNHGVVESGTTPGNDHFAHLDHSSPLQRMTDPSDPLHGSAWLKVR